MTKPPLKRSEVISCYQRGLSAPEIAKQLDMHRRTINRIIARFKKSGETQSSKSSGRPVRVATAEFVQLVEDLIRQNPEKSARSLARDLGVSRTTISRVIKEKLVRNEVIIPDNISSFDDSTKGSGADLTPLGRDSEHLDHPRCFEMILDEVPFPEMTKFNEEPVAFKSDAASVMASSVRPLQEHTDAVGKAECQLNGISVQADTALVGLFCPPTAMITEEGSLQIGPWSAVGASLNDLAFAGLLNTLKTEPTDCENHRITPVDMTSATSISTASESTTAAGSPTVSQTDFERRATLLKTCSESSVADRAEPHLCANNFTVQPLATDDGVDHSDVEEALSNGTSQQGVVGSDIACSKCAFVARQGRYNELERHYLDEHCIYECAICKLRLAGRQALMSHRVRHRLTTSCSLQTVPVSTATGTTVRNKKRSKPVTLKVQASEQKYVCTICSMKATRYDVLEAHYESAHNKKLEASRSRRNRQSSMSNVQ